jgi:ABC-type phosphate/phosphonate transport system ATPase subunit
VIDALVRAAAAAGATVLIASHELDRARALATNIVQLAGGTVIDRPREEVAAGV